MGRPHTCGIWNVKAGREDEFTAAWREMAQWATDATGGVGGARLLQDQSEATRFYSFGSWESNEVIADSRARPAFKERLEAIESLVDSFEMRIVEERAEVGDLCSLATA